MFHKLSKAGFAVNSLYDVRAQHYIAKRALAGGLASVVLAVVAPRVALAFWSFVLGALLSGLAAYALVISEDDLDAFGQQEVWTVVTQSELSRSLAHQEFQTKEEADKYYDEMEASGMACKLFDPSHNEIKQVGNPFAFDMKKEEERSCKVESMIEGKWMVVSETSSHNVRFHAFDRKEQANHFYDVTSRGRPRLLFDPSAHEARMDGSDPQACDRMRCRARPAAKGMLTGKWMVLSEFTKGQIHFHAFSSEEEANQFFSCFPSIISRVLFSPEGECVQTAGANWIALRRLRNMGQGKLKQR